MAESGGTRSSWPQRRNPAGQEARDLALRLISAVMVRRTTLESAMARAYAEPEMAALSARDKAFARLIAATCLRRHAELEAVLGRFIERPLPIKRGALRHILLVAAAQLLCLGTPAYAVINVAVAQCRGDLGARRYAKLANAVLRRIAEQGPSLLERAGGLCSNIPDWLWRRWVRTYGEEGASAIAGASLREAPLDITVLRDPAGWAQRLGGIVVAGQTVRLAEHARIEQLPGYEEGAWWIQDCAAAMPVRMCADVRGRRIADLCAAPGGKTLQLAAAGAHVTAVDVSPSRLQRLHDNLRRLQLSAEVIVGDVLDWSPAELFDGVLLDAPCTATGTIRRHPDMLHVKRAGDLAQLAEIQSRLLDRAFACVRPGGQLIYCTCSLEPEEGEIQIARFLARQPLARRVVISASQIGADRDWITAQGELRTLPCHSPHEDPRLSGVDGFFACCIKRAG